MDISYYGLSCFRLRGRDATIITNPHDRSTGHNVGRLTADIVLLTNPTLSYIVPDLVGGQPKVLRSPGEYEVKGVFVMGVPVVGEKKGQAPSPAGKTTAYVAEVDGLRVCHLGLPASIPTEDESEELENIDVLLVPVGGHGTLDAARAAEVVSMLEPKLVIPMLYRTEETRVDLEPIDTFLKELGAQDRAYESRTNVTKSNLPETTTVVLLDHRH